LLTTNQAAITALLRVINRYVGNFAPTPGVFPDIRPQWSANSDGERELTMMHWASVITAR
jgi:hypothetical protein